MDNKRTKQNILSDRNPSLIPVLNDNNDNHFKRKFPEDNVGNLVNKENKK
jgi:hypothetical protein